MFNIRTRRGDRSVGPTASVVIQETGVRMKADDGIMTDARVIVVDDDESNRCMLSRMLEDDIDHEGGCHQQQLEPVEEVGGCLVVVRLT